MGALLSVLSLFVVDDDGTFYRCFIVDLLAFVANLFLKPDNTGLTVEAGPGLNIKMLYQLQCTALGELADVINGVARY